MSGLAISVSGQFIDVFQGVLPVSFIQQELSLPATNSNSNNEAHYDFTVDASITVPLFYVCYEAGSASSTNYYFTKLTGNSWRLTLTGISYVNNGNRVKNWTEPMMKAGTKLIVGGYRG